MTRTSYDDHQKAEKTKYMQLEVWGPVGPQLLVVNTKITQKYKTNHREIQKEDFISEFCFQFLLLKQRVF